MRIVRTRFYRCHIGLLTVLRAMTSTSSSPRQGRRSVDLADKITVTQARAKSPAKTFFHLPCLTQRRFRLGSVRSFIRGLYVGECIFPHNARIPRQRAGGRSVPYLCLLGRHLMCMSCMSQFRIRDDGIHGAQVQVHRSKMKLMKRIPSVRFDQLKIFFISDTG